MITLSLAFHVAAGLVIFAGAMWIARQRALLTFVRRWTSPISAGIHVGHPLPSVKMFCQAFGIPFVGAASATPKLSRVSFATLLRLHYDCQLLQVSVESENNSTVSFLIRKSSDTIVEYQKQIELDFAQSFCVKISSAQNNSSLL